MTVIQYGSSVSAGNAKTRRHERRRKLAIERDAIGNIIDSILGCEAPDASQEESRKHVSRVDRATSLVALRDYQEPDEGGCVCLPDVALYSAGYRKSNNVTAR
ncbi:regulator [Cronobacter sakazakii]|nr:regulator [Cronobacter sakazakii]MBF4857738.1 regulator [Cronobacter sakazakii]